MTSNVITRHPTAPHSLGRSLKVFLLSFLFGVLPLGLTACDREGPAEETGEEIGEAIDDTTEEMTEAAEEAQEAAEEAQEGIEEAAEEVEEKTD